MLSIIKSLRWLHVMSCVCVFAVGCGTTGSGGGSGSQDSVAAPEDAIRDEIDKFCRDLSFTPWHSLAAHKPLGGINRARKTVYTAISTLRHQLNGVPRQEPTPDAEFKKLKLVD